MGYYNGEERDEICAQEVGRMAKLGRFDKEFELYGCAYSENKHIYYCISQYPQDIQQILLQSAARQIYPTPSEQYVKRIAVPAGMYEEIMGQTKWAFAKKLKQQYGQTYFDAIMPFAQVEPNDTSYMLLQKFAETLDGYYHKDDIQIFAGTVQMAYEAKVLSTTHYQQFQQWVAKQRKQMEDDPVITKNITRTFYGIGYLDAKQQIRYFVDAQEVATIDKKQKLDQDGFLVTPIYQQRYSVDHAGALSVVKAEYKRALEDKYNSAYFDFLQTIKNLPGVINQEQLSILQQKFEKNGYKKAANAIRYYSYRWNGIV